MRPFANTMIWQSEAFFPPHENHVGIGKFFVVKIISVERFLVGLERFEASEGTSLYPRSLEAPFETLKIVFDD